MDLCDNASDLNSDLNLFAADLLKLFAAAGILPGLWRLLGR